MSGSDKVAVKQYDLENEVNDDFILDDIEDMPGFVVPPTGSYSVVLEKGIEDKEINDEPYYAANMTIKEVLEVTEKGVEEKDYPKVGDIASTLFSRRNKFGMSNFKNFVASIAERYNTKKVGEIREHAKGAEMLVTVKRKYNKERDVYNLSVVTAQLL